MIRFQADADLRHRIVRAVRVRETAIDFASAAESGLIGLNDAAREGRILITHDRRTMPRHFRDRLEAGKPSPGVFIVSQFEPIGVVVEVLVTVWSASDPLEWRDQIRHLPSLSEHVFGRQG